MTHPLSPVLEALRDTLEGAEYGYYLPEETQSQIAAAITLLAEYIEREDWRPIDEMPYDTPVLLWHESGNVLQDFLYDSTTRIFRLRGYTHWKPITPPDTSPVEGEQRRKNQ